MRVAPVVAIAEIKSILKSSGDQYCGPAVAEKTGMINAGGHHEDHGDTHHHESSGTSTDTQTEMQSEDSDVLTEEDENDNNEE